MESPKELTEPKQMDGGKSYKAPVPDPSTGLDLSKLPVPDADISKLSLTMPSSSTHTAVPYSLLEMGAVRTPFHRSGYPARSYGSHSLRHGLGAL